MFPKFVLWHFKTLIDLCFSTGQVLSFFSIEFLHIHSSQDFSFSSWNFRKKSSSVWRVTV